MAYFKILSQHLPGGTKENNEKVGEDSWCRGQTLNQAFLDHKSETLLLELTNEQI
jgi:hypothetical protein